MTKFEREKKAQEGYTEVIKELREKEFYPKKGAQGQHGFTREYKEDRYTVWETISFFDKKVYVYKQLNPWTPFKKNQINLSEEEMGSVSQLLELIETARQSLK